MKKITLIFVIVIMMTGSFTTVCNAGPKRTNRDQSKYMDSFEFLLSYSDDIIYNTIAERAWIIGYYDGVIYPDSLLVQSQIISFIETVVFSNNKSLYPEIVINSTELYEGIEADSWLEEGLDLLVNYNKDIFNIDGYKLDLMSYTKPEELVCYMVKLLGHESEMKSRRYPIDYVVKGYEIGLLDRLDFAYGANISNAEFTRFIENAYFVKLNPLNNTFKNYSNLLEVNKYAVYNDMKVHNLNLENEYLELIDSEDNIERFYFDLPKQITDESKQELINKLPKGRELSIWIYYGDDGRDMEIKRYMSITKPNDLILRIDLNNTKRQVYSVNETTIKNIYDSLGNKVDAVEDVSNISKIVVDGSNTIYDINEYVMIMRNGNNISSDNKLKIGDKVKVSYMDKKPVVFDIYTD